MLTLNVAKMEIELKIIFERLEKLVLAARNHRNGTWAWTADAFVEAALVAPSQSEFYKLHENLKPVDFDPSGEYLQTRFQPAIMGKRTPRAVPEFTGAVKPFWASDFQAAWAASPNGYESRKGKEIARTPQEIVWEDTASNVAGVLISTGKKVAERVILGSGGNVAETKKAIRKCYKELSRMCEARGFEMEVSSIAFMKGATTRPSLGFYIDLYEALWRNGKGQKGPPKPKAPSAPSDPGINKEDIPPRRINFRIRAIPDNKRHTWDDPYHSDAEREVAKEKFLKEIQDANERDRAERVRYDTQSVEALEGVLRHIESERKITKAKKMEREERWNMKREKTKEEKEKWEDMLKKEEADEKKAEAELERRTREARERLVWNSPSPPPSLLGSTGILYLGGTP
jgi:hypothetical protein